MLLVTAFSLVLSGGNALGAYHAGAWDVLEAAALEPDWVVGTSIGAVTAAIIAGNPPGKRGAALQKFWTRAKSYDGAAAFLPEIVRQPLQYAQALSSRLLGRPSLFTLKVPDLAKGRSGQFDAGPMRQLLADLVDIELMNSGAIRLSVLALDLASGDEVVFDTRAGHVGLDHILASAALIPDFPAVEIGGRFLVDGGLSANLAIHLVLEEEAARESREKPPCCFALDLFPSAAPLPQGILQVAQRQSDLIFASQSARTLKAMHRLWIDRDPGADLFYLAYEAIEDETALKAYDFGEQTLARRRAAGARDMQIQVEKFLSGISAHGGLCIHPLK